MSSSFNRRVIRCLRLVPPERLLLFRAPPAARGTSCPAISPVHHTHCPQFTPLFAAAHRVPQVATASAVPRRVTDPALVPTAPIRVAALHPPRRVSHASENAIFFYYYYSSYPRLCLTVCSTLSASLLSTVRECQEGAGASLLPIIMGFSASGMAIVGKCPAALFILQKQNNTALLSPQFSFLFIVTSRSGARPRPPSRLTPCKPLIHTIHTIPTKPNLPGRCTLPVDTVRARLPSPALCSPSTRPCSRRRPAPPAFSAATLTPGPVFQKGFTGHPMRPLRRSRSFTKAPRRR